METAKELAVRLGEEVERRKDAEALLVRQNDKLEQMVVEKVGHLRESELRFRILVQTIPGVVIQLNQSGEIVDCNPNAETVFGKGKSLHGATFVEDFLPKSDARGFDDYAKKVRGTSSSEIFEGTVILPGERTRVFSWNIAAIEPNGDAAQIVATGQDITVLKNTQQLMIQSEKMLSWGGLAAGLAHELNSPLSGAMQSLQVVRQRLDVSEKNVEAARHMNVDLESINRYLKDGRF